MQSVMRWIAACYPHISCPISATGGVTNYEDVVRYLLAGAGNVQIATLVYLKGYDSIRAILEQLEAYMERQGVAALEDIVGVAAKKVLPLEKADRSKRYYADIDYEKCVGCKKCYPVCIYDAIDGGSEKPVIRQEKCDGCGLCAQVCNRAITMRVR